MNETISPKGRFRMFGWIIISIIYFYLTWRFLGDKWVLELISDLAQSTALSAIAYWVLRSYHHNRTHELSIGQMADRENYLIILVGLIFAGSAVS